MSGKSPIQWTEATWNPVVGCKRVSAGCDHCYAFELHDKRHIAWKRGRWPNAPEQYHKPFSQVQLLPKRLEDPLHWRKPRRVFVNSMSDLFHESVPDEYIRQIFKVMGEASRHTFQVLTKRPERMQRIVSEMAREGDFATLSGGTEPPFPWPNVWLGVSVENQQAADERIPLLLDTPAAVRFLSCEPLIGQVDLAHWLVYSPQKAEWCLAHYGSSQPLSWVIVGGESGRFARAMQWDWLASLMFDCEAAGVPVFVKQLGSVLAREVGSHDAHGGDMDDWPAWARVRDFPVAESAVPS